MGGIGSLSLGERAGRIILAIRLGVASRLLWSGLMAGPAQTLAERLREPECAQSALGVQVSRADGTIARISGATARSLTELTQAFPVQVIDPGVHKLVEEGGHRRRRWMDWAVFHVEHQFGDWWLRYTRILKQRNAALRTSARPSLRLGCRARQGRRTHRRVPAPVCREPAPVLARIRLRPERPRARAALLQRLGPGRITGRGAGSLEGQG